MRVLIELQIKHDLFNKSTDTVAIIVKSVINHIYKNSKP